MWGNECKGLDELVSFFNGPAKEELERVRTKRQELRAEMWNCFAFYGEVRLPANASAGFTMSHPIDPQKNLNDWLNTIVQIINKINQAALDIRLADSKAANQREQARRAAARERGKSNAAALARPTLPPRERGVSRVPKLPPRDRGLSRAVGTRRSFGMLRHSTTKSSSSASPATSGGMLGALSRIRFNIRGGDSRGNNASSSSESEDDDGDDDEEWGISSDDEKLP